jgi:predicted transposase YbfD/YdcC
VDGFEVGFVEVPDPRAANARHDLVEILFIALAATLCGAETCTDMAQFAESKQGVLRRFLRLEHGPPSHDTFSRVFRLLDPDRFEAAFRQFMAAFAQSLKATETVVAIDGKSLRGAFERGAKATPLHLVSAWAADQRLVLGQRQARGRGEVKAALELVALLRLHGCIVTADALHGHRAKAEAIRAQGGDYVLAIKGNRGPLFHTVRALLDDDKATTATITANAHGRFEQRCAHVVVAPPDLAARHGFAGLLAIARVDSRRRLPDQPEEHLSRYFLLSAPLTPEAVLRTVRAHWTIENTLHWTLDVVLDEDRARSRKDSAGHNLALLRRLALNILQHDPHRAPIRRKIKRAGWDDAYLLTLLGQMR